MRRSGLAARFHQLRERHAEEHLVVFVRDLERAARGVGARGEQARPHLARGGDRFQIGVLGRREAEADLVAVVRVAVAKMKIEVGHGGSAKQSRDRDPRMNSGMWLSRSFVNKLCLALSDHRCSVVITAVSAEISPSGADSMPDASEEAAGVADGLTPICAIGASAGGMGALQQFFERDRSPPRHGVRGHTSISRRTIPATQSKSRRLHRDGVHQVEDTPASRQLRLRHRARPRARDRGQYDQVPAV